MVLMLYALGQTIKLLVRLTVIAAKKKLVDCICCSRTGIVFLALQAVASQSVAIADSIDLLSEQPVPPWKMEQFARAGGRPAKIPKHSRTERAVVIECVHWDCSTGRRFDSFSKAKDEISSFWAALPRVINVAPRLDLLISRFGEVSHVRIIKSSGDARTDQICIAKLERLHFESPPVKWIDYAEFTVAMDTGDFNPDIKWWRNRIRLDTHPIGISLAEYEWLHFGGPNPYHFGTVIPKFTVGFGDKF
jgi:hypothetical protein